MTDLLCAECGIQPRLHYRTICRTCRNRRDWVFRCKRNQQCGYVVIPGSQRYGLSESDHAEIQNCAVKIRRQHLVDNLAAAVKRGVWPPARA